MAPTNKSEYIKKLFNDIAPSYDITNSVMSLGMNNHWRKEAAKLAALTPEGKVADFCCGTGALAFKIAELGQSEVVGFDYSEKMIEEANRQASHKQIKNIRFVAKDLYQNGYPENYFDAVTSAWGLRNTDNYQKSLEEMMRIVRPGGRIIVLEMGNIANKKFNRFYWKIFGFIIPIIGYVFTKNFDAYRYFYQSSEQFFSQKELMQIMDALEIKNIICKNFLFGAIAIVYGEK